MRAVHQGGLASTVLGGAAEKGGWERGRREGAEFRIGCEFVLCGLVKVDMGVWVQSTGGNWAGDAAVGNSQTSTPGACRVRGLSWEMWASEGRQTIRNL